MSKRDKYAPDYRTLYPGVTISSAVIRALDQSDRKMQYFELDLKTERKRKDKRTKAITVSPAREDSLDRLTENNEHQYLLEGASPEDTLIERDELERLRLALKRLEPEEQALIRAIYFNGITVRNYAKQVSCPTMTIQNRKKRIFAKLKKMMEK